MRFRRRREPKPKPAPPEWETWGRLDLPERAVIDTSRGVGREHHWQHARTVIGGGGQSGPLPIVDGVVPVRLPDDYVGRFEVHLISEDAVLVVAEGRRLPSLDWDLWTWPTTASACDHGAPIREYIDRRWRVYRGQGLADWARLQDS